MRVERQRRADQHRHRRRRQACRGDGRAPAGALEGVFITDSDIRHIKRKHGNSEESREQVAVEPSDFGRIPFVLNEFGTCEHTDTGKLGNKKFLLAKSMGDTAYLVTIQRGKRKLEIKTMWKRKPGASC